MDLYSFSESDIVALREVIAHVRRNGLPSREHTPAEGDESYTPEVYVAEVPEEGIDARDGITPGVAQCSVYRVINGELGEVEALTKPVYNLSDVAVDGGQFILIKRDKFGTWFASVGGGGGRGVFCKINDVTSIVAHYDATIYEYVTTGTNKQSTGVNVWLFDFARVTSNGLTPNLYYEASPTGKSLEIDGETRPVYQASGGWLNAVTCDETGFVRGVTY